MKLKGCAYFSMYPLQRFVWLSWRFLTICGYPIILIFLNNRFGFTLTSFLGTSILLFVGLGIVASEAFFAFVLGNWLKISIDTTSITIAHKGEVRSYPFNENRVHIYYHPTRITINHDGGTIAVKFQHSFFWEIFYAPHSVKISTEYLIDSFKQVNMDVVWEYKNPNKLCVEIRRNVDDSHKEN